ncbi:hypothetical protein [Marinimicrobium sp. ABcell2]|uniref:hypothetical protein n=1 Tax=Marinimicrobium sp. ABcell2 TaxID=3069751 RepID=UPI0027B7BCF0|nr:hypothetical protein [Marinimicrobium sp. ABcell2]MDQ2077393.1 hypothetical protein [Marinimicrobium sp. ABcell2]
MSAMNMLPIHNGALSLAPLDATQVLTQYPGIGRVKPATYFGEDIRCASARFGLTDPDQKSAWYNRVYLAYGHYWKETLGRLHCWEPNDQSPLKHKAALVKSIVTPVVPEAYIAGSEASSQHGIHLGFEIPPVELLRRANALPSMVGTLQIAQSAPKNVEPLFYRVDAHSVSSAEQRAHGLHVRADVHGQAWLSANERALMDLPAEAVSSVAYSRQAQPAPLVNRYVASPWEELSVSVGAAHLGRLAGITGAWSAKPTLRGLAVAGAVRAMMAERMGPVLNLLPPATPVGHGLGRVYFTIDSSVLSEVLRTARQQRLLPLAPAPESIAHHVGDESAFEILFGVLLNARYTDVHTIDDRALQKGGIL